MPAVKLDEMQWGAPPPAWGRGKSGESIYTPLVLALKERPGEWGLVAIGKGVSVDPLKAVVKRLDIGGTLESASRSHDGNGTRALYARWLPSAA